MSSGGRLATFVYSRRNLAGSLGALVGLGLLATGVLSSLGALAIAAIPVLYVIGYLVVPVPAAQAPAVLAAPVDDTAAVGAGLDRLLVSIHGRVADDIFALAESIRESILVTLPAAASSFSVADPNVYLIRRTALAYLPDALSSYLAIPRAFAEGQAVANGRTAHDALLEQLDVMDSKMREVADDIARHDTDKLLANGRFVAERFGTSALDMTPAAAAIPVPAEAPAPAKTPAPAETAAPAETRERVL